MESAAFRDRIGRRDRRRHGVHSPQRNQPAARRPPPSLRGTAGHCGCSRRPTPTRPSAEPLDQLVDLGADVRISYDLSTTRLHAKAWVFHRRLGLLDGLRRLVEPHALGAGHRTGVERPGIGGPQPRRHRQVRRRVRQLLGERRLRSVRPRRIRRRAATGRRGPIDGPHVILSPIELRPCPFQERLLELIELSRQHGHHRNLLVSATGTGKTVMAALDYGALRQRLDRSRLLFVAHREEILDQSLATFRYALRDASFGEKWVGGARPTRFEHVFASIQSLQRERPRRTCRPTTSTS